jgi:hypothetical protein
MSEEKSTFAKREDESGRTQDQLPDLAAKKEEAVKGGQVSMNDFHFVMRNNSSSPG